MDQPNDSLALYHWSLNKHKINLILLAKMFLRSINLFAYKKIPMILAMYHHHHSFSGVFLINLKYCNNPE